MTTDQIDDKIPGASGDIARAPQMIFNQDVTLPVAKFDLPEVNGRIATTFQLAYCLSLLGPSLVSKEELDKPEFEWSQARINDLDEQHRLRTMATDVVRAFIRDERKTLAIVTETTCLATVLDEDEFRKLIEVFVNEIEQELLLKVHLLDGLAQLMRNAPPGSLDPDDLVKILELLSRRLKGTHQQSTQHTYQLTLAVSNVLDSMVDCQVEGIESEQLQEPLSQYLEGLQKSPDPCLVYQAAYAYQALRYVPDDETILQRMLRRTGKVVKGVSGVVSAVKALDINSFIEGLCHIQIGLAGAGEAIGVVSDAYNNAKALAESGREFLDSLRDGLNFTRKSSWYPALRGLDTLLQEGRLAEFEKLIRESPCRLDPAFQWGVCQRLGELAANTLWDADTRQRAVIFLGEIYSDDAQWGKQANVKQWILHIINELSESSKGIVGSHAQTLLQDYEPKGDSQKHVLDRSGSGSSILLTNIPLRSRGSSLIESVQDIPEVETPLQQLKQERLRERNTDVYISPRAKVNASAKEDFDLTSKVLEFLSSNKKVFLLLGDSGAGKSTFNRALEFHLWDEYRASTGRIPLFIHLPTIEKPEHDLVAERLRRANFTENQIRELKLRREFILICDGYDESQQTRNLYTSNGFNHQGEWRVQMVISCRTEYNDVDYKDCFQPTDLNGGRHSGLYQEAVLAPFNKNQIQDYIKQYVSLSKPSWGTRDYLKALNHIPNLQDLVTNPFLLKIALDVLPKLVDTQEDFSKTRVTRLELYDGFVAQWIERGKIRLREMELSPRDKEAFKILLDSGFSHYGIVYMKELATAIYEKQNGNPVVNYSDHRDQKSWKKSFFDNSDGKNLLREVIPLIRNSDQYRFMHKSVLEYGLALAVFDPSEQDENTEPTSTSSRRGSTSSVLSFEEQALFEKPAPAIDQPLLDSPFGRRNFVDAPSVLRFLVERAQQRPVFKLQLLAVIERSKTEKSARTAAANAMTVLVRADVQFIGADLRGINIPGADLSYGMFDSAQLKGADLRKALLRSTWLRKADLSAARMTGVDFGELPLLQENDLVTCNAYSPDGRLHAVGLMNGDITLYETSTWEKIQILKGSGGSITCFVFSKTSARIVSGSSNGNVQLWDIETGSCINTLDGHTGDVTGVVYSPNGNQIASGSWDESVRLWDIETHSCVHILAGHYGLVTSVVYSPNGDRVASGSWDESVRLWDVKTGDCIHALNGHSDFINSVVYSPNGDQIASGSNDKTVRLWNVETGECIHTLQGHSDIVSSLAYSPSGDQVASGSYDNSLRLWNVETGKSIYNLQGHGGTITTIVYSPKGDQIASGSNDKTVRLWDIETGSCVQTLHGHINTVTSVVYSPDGDQIASGSTDMTVRLRDLDDTISVHVSHGHGDIVTIVVYSPKGDQIASGSIDYSVRLWDVKTGGCIHTLQGHTDYINSIAYSPSGDQIASGGGDTTVRLWDVETGKCIYTMEGHTEYLLSVVFSPNGAQVASASYDYTVRLWDVETGNCLHVLKGHERLVRCLAYSPSGDRVASGSWDMTLKLWNVETGACVETLRGHTHDVRSVLYSPARDQIATGSLDMTVRLWDAKTGQCIRTFQGHTGLIGAMVYSPNGNQIATGSEDNTVRLWNVETGVCVHTLEGHSSDVRSVVFSPNGDRIASGCADMTVGLWDTETGDRLTTISGFNGAIYSIAWEDTLEGYYLVTASGDRSVRRWQIIKGQDEYQVCLCWSSSHDALTVAGANFNEIQGLSPVNRKLLNQRGATLTTSPSNS